MLVFHDTTRKEVAVEFLPAVYVRSRSTIRPRRELEAFDLRKLAIHERTTPRRGTVLSRRYERKREAESTGASIFESQHFGKN